MRIILTALLLLLSLQLHLAPAGAEINHTLRVDTVAHGVRLSLIVPRSVYPRGAITRVMVQVQNLSRQTLTVVPGCAFRVDNPQVQALTPRGVMHYPPAVHAIDPNPLLPCTGGGATGPGVLMPGTSLRWNVLVIIAASRLRATVVLTPVGPNNRIERAFTVVGQTLPVRVVEAPRPRVIRCSASCFRVLPPAGTRVTGPLYYAYSVKCKDANGNVAYGQQLLLAPAAGRTLHIGCGAPLAKLHLVAGWLDQPVSRINTIESSA